MLHDHAPLCATRVAVLLCGVRLPRRRDARLLKRRAAARALALLSRAGSGWDVWSHAFRFDGAGFLLSTHLQPARDFDRRANGRGARIERLLARLVIEVSPAPPALIERTLLYRRAPAEERGRSRWIEARALAA